MRKITELLETKYRTVREKDLTGKKIARQVEYKSYRKINVISTGKRFAHAFVDGIVYYVIYYIFQFIWLSISGNDVIGNIFAGLFISIFFMFSFPIYYIVFEHLMQRTPGKFLTKSIVVDIYGNKPDISTNILRNIIRLVPFETLSCLSERGWHDRWSDTFVITEEEYLIIKELHLKNESETILSDDTVKLPNSKRMKHVFLYVILPISIILYIGIVYKGCTETKKILNNPELIKEVQKQQEANQQSQH